MQKTKKPKKRIVVISPARGAFSGTFLENKFPSYRFIEETEPAPTREFKTATKVLRFLKILKNPKEKQKT
jgi:hypothetical protein